MSLTVDDLLRQPLTWNFRFSNARGYLLGSRPRLNRASLDASIACNALSYGCNVMNMYFNVAGDGRLWHVYSTSDVWMSANISAIGVVARSRKKWYLDPSFQECLLYCSLWVF